MKAIGPIPAVVALFFSLTLASSAQAQLSWRWFGSKSSDKSAPAKAPASDPRRPIEIAVELAWLADPITFPYYLEAHVNNSQELEVRGYVPGKSVREHALRIAQIYSSLPVTDSMKEHSSLLVRPSQMSPQQLQNSVVSSLKVALPKQAAQLKVDCDGEGKVYVFGQVNSIEEKIAVSHSLRRLHGCTSVQNMISVPAEAPQIAGVAMTDKTPASDTKSKSWLPWPLARGATKQEPPLLEPQKKAPVLEPKATNIVDVSNKAPSGDGTILIPPVITVRDKAREPEPAPAPVREPMKVDVPTPAAKAPLSSAELKKRIQTACPNLVSVEATFTSATEVRIEMELRTDDEINPAAERVLALPELQNYTPTLQFKVGSP